MQRMSIFKLKIAPAFSVLRDKNNLPEKFYFDKVFFNKAFQIILLNDDKNKNLNLID